jgi:hypothetical protein
MSNPTITHRRTRVIHFCLASNPVDPDLICTRLSGHTEHCCDEISGAAWNGRSTSVRCSDKHNHSAEKGLPLR